MKKEVTKNGVTKKDAGKKNIYSIISFVSAMILLILNFFWPVNFGLKLGFIIMSILALVALVFGVIGKNNSSKIKDDKKWLYRIGVFIAILFGLLDLSTLLVLYKIEDIKVADEVACTNIKHTKDCVKETEEIASCKFVDSIDIKCSVDKLTEEQFKN